MRVDIRSAAKVAKRELGIFGKYYFMPAVAKYFKDKAVRMR